MRYELVIFDLDGTVLDTLRDLANAVNYALELHGHPRHTLDEIRSYIGNGVANLISKSVPAGTGEEECRAILKDFKAYYGAHVNVETVPYPGIPELLKALRDAGIRVGVNSNKYHLALSGLCEAHFPQLYDVALGECETTPRKPDPIAALRIAEEMNVPPERAVYIGDSAVDHDTAKNAGMDFIWVSWGFRSAEDMQGYDIRKSFESVEELGKYLLG